MVQKKLKRIFDISFSLILLMLSSPFMVVSMISIKIFSPESPVIFKQKRVGYKGKVFEVYKLRSMTNEWNEETGELLPDEERLKTWGKIIRKTNIDEIPQVINILKGEMSLIGPRPLMKMEMQVMNRDEQKKRQSVLPGISGWEAINESKALTRRAMAELDLYYVEYWSLWLDIKIFLKTVYIIFANKRPSDNIRAPKMEMELKEK